MIIRKDMIMMTSTIINAIPEYLITAVVSAVIYFGFDYVENLIHIKILHAKTAQSKELWSFIEQVANTAVSSLVNADLTGNEKFNKATLLVQNALTKQGFTNVDVKAIESAVQSAYEKSPLTPTANPEKADKKLNPIQSPDLMRLQAIQTKPGVDLVSQPMLSNTPLKPATPQLEQRIAGKGIPVKAAQQANEAGDTNGTN